MHHIFQAEQWLPYPVETVFAFFSNPENLPRLMPEWQRARIETSAINPPPPPPPGVQRASAPTAAGNGTTLTLSFLPFPWSPFRIHWDAEISDFSWNQQFCDTQLRGPFRFWHHCHKLQPSSHPASSISGTLLRDEIEYQLPLEPVSRIALPLVRAQFRAIFRYRHQQTEELLRQATSTR